ncbi:MAG: aldehyde dehydrogenase family protein [Acidobacteria bacterium]|nr:aldehyde dehydrogenase family protein [Acidobacteriota bacterium]
MITPTPAGDVDLALAQLAAGAPRWRDLSLERRLVLASACLDGVAAEADAWIDEASRAKGLAPDDPRRGEEVLAGPLATARYLRLLVRTLHDIREHGAPRLPAPPRVGADGRLRARVAPVPGLFDSLVFGGCRAEVWFEPGTTAEDVARGAAPYYRASPAARPAGVTLVLGAGNVSSIAATDVLTKLFHDGRVVLLKMNPVNETLGPLLARAFAPLVEGGYLRVVYGGADVGGCAARDARVGDVHLTGSLASHQALAPALAKPLTSELGCVAPWIVVPARYGERELRFQAANLAASVLNNASFNCAATRVVVTHRGWPQRGRFLDLVDAIFAADPPRPAYYPGARERFARFAGREPAPGPALRPALLRGVDPAGEPALFREESFAPVVGETALDAADDIEYMARAAEFANERLWGTLCATVIVHPSTRAGGAGAQAFRAMLAGLRYGTVAVNCWSALSFVLMSTPWGGYPGATAEDPQSGRGWVHNTFLLERCEKSVIEAPLTVFPKPAWFPSHPHAATLTRRVVGLYHRPSVWKVPPLIGPALAARL